jgi:hypothetical protein
VVDACCTDHLSIPRETLSFVSCAMQVGAADDIAPDGGDEVLGTSMFGQRSRELMEMLKTLAEVGAFSWQAVADMQLALVYIACLQWAVDDASHNGGMLLLLRHMHCRLAPATSLTSPGLWLWATRVLASHPSSSASVGWTCHAVRAHALAALWRYVHSCCILHILFRWQICRSKCMHQELYRDLCTPLPVHANTSTQAAFCKL